MSSVSRCSRCSSDDNVADVVLYGLIVCLPMIQSDCLLRIPSIGSSYYKLVSSLCDQHAECVFRLLNAEQYSMFLSTIQSGLDNYDNEICKLALETIQSLALHLLQHNENKSCDDKTKYLEHFLEHLVQDVMTSTTTVSDLFETLAGTIFTLICTFPNQFYCCLTRMKQQDGNVTSSIDRFVHDIGQAHQYNRRAKLEFTSKLESFVTDLRRHLRK
jgi:hypothetical protein